MPNKNNQEETQIKGLGASDIYELTEEERKEEEETGILNQKSISLHLK